MKFRSSERYQKIIRVADRPGYIRIEKYWYRRGTILPAIKTIFFLPERMIDDHD